jgi:hypothetical protein
MENPKQEKQRQVVQGLFILLGFMTLLTWACQLVIFPTWRERGQSLLIGICLTLFGAFAAVLASPYGAEDEKRLSRVSTTVFTLGTGFVLAKIIDPLIAQIIGNSGQLLSGTKGPNLLIGMIGFLAGFMGTYVYRAQLGMDIFREDSPAQPLATLPVAVAPVFLEPLGGGAATPATPVVERSTLTFF